MFPILLIAGLVGIVVGIFWNEGWEMATRPVEPWAAAVMIESFAFVCLLAAGCSWYASKVNGKSPQRVVVTETTLIVPKGMFSRVELTLPLEEIDVSVFNLRFVTQLQIKHGRKKVLVTSALSPTDEDFEQLLDHLT